jgi:hypothetical protein
MLPFEAQKLVRNFSNRKTYKNRLIIENRKIDCNRFFRFADQFTIDYNRFFDFRLSIAKN